MSTHPSHKIETLCVHAGVSPEPITGAVMTPIFQTSTFEYLEPGKHKGYDYSRAGNPTRTALETALAALEGATHAISFASGLAAEQAIIQTLEPGSHVIVSDDTYGGTGRLFRRLFAKYNIEFEFIDLRNLPLLAQKIRPQTRMIWIETPTNPLLRIVDIQAITDLAKKASKQATHERIVTVVDNTFCSPILQKPLSLGADIVIHSTTKYIGGHSDLIGGAVMLNNQADAESLRFIQFAAGAVNAPFECFLLLRSIKTLALRMAKHNTNAQLVAHALKSIKNVKEVIYPGLKSHPEHLLASQQMQGFGGMISFRIEGGFEAAKQFFSRLRLFTLAESLGGVESLANHPQTMTHASVPESQREKLGIGADLIRLSIGIEDASDLIQDLSLALDF